MLTALWVILGIGAVILVHELGHFLAARFAGVRVETFSIGFGPKLLGFRRGETTFCLSLIPFGGYVKMAGEALGEGTGRPGELGAASKGHRCLIFAAGVVMNFLFALVVFTVVFAVGVPFKAPVAGRVAKGGPAWKAGLPVGAEILAVDGAPVLSFTDVSVAVALGGEEVVVTARPSPGEPPREYRLKPELDPAGGFRQIQIDAPVEERILLEVDKGGPAAAAGLKDGDRLVAVDGRELRAEETAELAALLEQPGPRRLTVERSRPGETPERIEASLVPGTRSGPRKIGVQAATRRVDALQPSPLVRRSGLLVGDVILAAQGRPIHGEADLEQALATAGGEAVLRVRRLGAGNPGPGETELRIPLGGPAEARALLGDVAFAADGTHVVPMPGLAAARSGLLAGDLVERIDDREVADWPALRQAIAAAGDRPITLQVRRGAERLTRVLQAEPVTLPDFGFQPVTPYLNRDVRAGGPWQAVVLGVRTSVSTLKQVYLSLKKVLAGQVAARNLGGPVMIVTTSATLIQQGLMKFLWFLAVISINLAFLNILPLPVLDGGHLFFLLVERIKGSPVSERVLTYAQVAGLALILGLMVFVTYNDLVRLLSSLAS